MHRVGQPGSEYVEREQTVQQKEQISRQMIDMLGDRLRSLEQLAVNRRHGLSSDIDSGSAHCTRLVPKLKQAHEEHEERKTKRHTN